MSAFSDQIEAARKTIDAGNATQADIDALQAAYDAFEANYPNPSRVTTAYNKAKTFLQTATNNNLVGDELAQYSEATATALQTTLDKYAEFSGVSLAEINAAVNEIEAALAAFKASVKLPEAGKYYLIRSASKGKFGNGSGDFTGTQYKSIVYSDKAATADGNVKFFKPKHSTEVTSDNPNYTLLTDSVSADDDLRIVWKAESAADGKIVLRNVGTGMYLDASNGAVKQSTTPVEVLVEGIEANTFRFNAGEDASGTVQYMNAKGATNTVVVWKDASDVNSNWTIEEVEEGEMDVFVRFNDIKVGQLTPMTLSVDVDPTGGDIDVAYTVVGMSTDDEGNKLVLAEADKTIPAGTPFIASFVESSTGSTVYNAQLSIAADDVNSINYGFDAKTVNGLVGVLVKNDTIAAGMQYFTQGAVKAVAEKATVEIGVSSAYLNGCVPATEEEGDETIDLGKVDVTSISNAKAVVLPSTVNVYSVNGYLIRKAVKSANATKGLPAGCYIIGGHKVLVK